MKLKKIDWNILIVLGTSVFIVSMVMTSILFLFESTGEMMLYRYYERKTGCEGTEQFFTDRGFLYDLDIMYEHHNNFENNEGLNIKPLPPIDIGKSEYDCEDFAHAVECLSRLYEIDCKFYMMYEIEENYNSFGHVGNVCYVDGRWTEVH